MTSPVPDDPLRQPTQTPRPLETRDDLIQWIAENRDKLGKIIATSCRSRDANHIDDVMQDITFAAIKEVDKGKSIDYPSAFFFQLLIPQTVGKTGKAAVKCRAREQKKARETPESDERTPATSAEQRELVLAVREAIKSIAEGDETAGGILRGLCDGKMQTQIAIELGIPKQTLHSRLIRSIEPKLRLLLDRFLKP